MCPAIYSRLSSSPQEWGGVWRAELPCASGHTRFISFSKLLDDLIQKCRRPVNWLAEAPVLLPY